MMRFTEKNKQNLTSKSAWNRLISAVSIALLGASGIAQAAATAPDAGQILQEIERDLEVKPIPEAPVIEAAPLEEDQGEKIVIKQFKFEGNKVLNAADLEEALSSLTNQEITVNQLKTCVDLISAYYRQKGYLAVATLPEQDITDGVVIIQIVEASYGGVKFDGEYGKDFKRIRPSVIERLIEASVKKGEALAQNAIDHALAIAQRMAGFSVAANYQAGEKEGATDVLVKIKDKPLVSASVSADNTGGRATGRDKQTATLSFASPLGYGDTLNFIAVHSRGTDYLSGAYMLPVGSKGWQVGVNASHLSYDVILDSFSTLKPKGSSDVFGLDAKYPLYFSKKGQLDLELNYDHKEFVNQQKSLTDHHYFDTNDYKVDVASIKMIGTMNDSFLSGAVNTAQLDLAHGKVDLDGSGLPGDQAFDHKLNDHNGANTQGNYNRLKWNLTRTQFLSDDLSLSLDASGQFADKNLDSSEKFYLGGIGGVRAYPTSEGAGSEGYLAKLELRKYLPNNLTVSAFIDEGYVKQFETNKNNAGANAGKPLTDAGVHNGYLLKGYGFSVAWSGPYNSTLKVTYARRFGSNPNPSVDATTGTEHDQDGALKKDVFWLSGSIAF
jgi:hemolysin activation/secretion protein